MQYHALKCLLLATTGSALSTAGPAAAQQADSATSEIYLEEVTVTARKMEESLSDAPLSVVAVSGDEIQAASIIDIEDLALLAPGLTFNESANSRGRGPRIRGVGTNLFGDGIEASVATYVDGVILGRQAMGINDLIDIERVEVLRGPQGTLFGKNASVGVVNIITKAPRLDAFEFDGSASYGRQSEDSANELLIGASAAGPLVADKLGFRLTGYNNDRDGFLTNVNTGNEFNDKREYGGRGKLLWVPDNNISFLLAADYSRRDQDCCITTALRYGETRSNEPAFTPVEPGPGNTDVFIDRENEFFQDQEQWGVSGEINWDFERFTVTSITAFREWTVDDNNEFENNPPGFGNDVLRNDAEVDHDQFSQEIRIAWSSGDRLQYVAGLFYFDQTVDAETSLLLNLASGPPVPGGNDVARSVDTRSAAVFGQLDYSLTDDLVLLLGGRYTDEELDYDFDRVVADGGFFGFVPPTAFSGSTADDAFSGLIGLQYFVDDNMFYATWSRGYKGQGVNVNNFVSQFEIDNGLEIVDAEVPTNYEVGARTKWLDGRLFLDATLFYTEFEDYQLSVFDPDTNSSGLRNAAELETFGLEASFRARASEYLTLSGAVTWMDASYSDFPNGPCYPGQGVGGDCVDNDGSGVQDTPDTQDLSGEPLQNAPDLSFNLTASYERPISGAGWSLFANGTLYWQDDVQFNVNQDPAAVSDSFTRVNTSVGLVSSEGQYRVTLFVRNLLDEEYPLTVLSPGSNDLGGQNQFLPFDYARVWGLRLNVSLN